MKPSFTEGQQAGGQGETRGRQPVTGSLTPHTGQDVGEARALGELLPLLGEGDLDVVFEELSPHTALRGEREISVPESQPHRRAGLHLGGRQVDLCQPTHGLQS